MGTKIKHNFKKEYNGKIIISGEDNYIDDNGECFDIDMSSPKIIKVSKVKNGPEWPPIQVRGEWGSGTHDHPPVSLVGYSDCNCVDIKQYKDVFIINVTNTFGFNSFTLTLKSFEMQGASHCVPEIPKENGGTTVTIGEP